MPSRSRGAVMAPAVLTLLTMSIAPAHAGGKYARGGAPVKVDIKRSDRTHAIAPRPDGAPPAPALTSDQVLADQGSARLIRKEQVELVERLLAETPDDHVDEKADLYYRLADLHALAQRYWRLEATRLLIKGDKGADQAAKQARDELLAAIKAYRSLVEDKRFRSYANMDKALFYYGYALAQGTYMKEARVVYQRLLQDYPGSPFVPEALLSFADYYFEQNDLADAASFYTKVLQLPVSSATWYAAYKMGWVDLNLQQNEEALEAFYKVASATAHDPKLAALNRAAKKDLVRAYAEVGNVRTASRYFRKVDASFAFDMEQILGDLFLDQGKAEKAIFVFRELIGLDPRNQHVCVWQYDVAHAMLTAGATAQKVEEIEKLVALYTALAGKRTLPAPEAEACHDDAAAMAGEMARAYHSEFAKTHDPDTLAAAATLYRVYLRAFPDAADLGETQYYYADLLWARADLETDARLATQRWEDAAIAFTDVVTTKKVDAARMKNSAYAAVLGWKNAVDLDPRNRAQPARGDHDPTRPPTPEPIPAAEQKMIAAFDFYLTYIKDPKDPELVGMRFMKANIYRRHDHLDQAIPMFADIVAHHRDHEAALDAAIALIDSLIRLGRDDEMLGWVDRLAADQRWLADKPAFAAQLDGLQRVSLRKRAEQLEADAKRTGSFATSVACGQAYLDIYNRDPQGDKGDELLYDAGVCFEQGKSIGVAIVVFQRLRKAYPSSPVAAKALARLGKDYADVAYYDKASDAYEEYAKQYAGEQDAYDAMSDAVFFRKGLGDNDQALADTAYFIKTFGAKKKADAATAFFNATSIYEQRGDPDQVVAHLRQYLSRYGAIGGDDRVVQAWTKIGELRWAQSCPVKTVAGACVKEVRERAVSSTGSRRRARAELPLQCGPETKIKAVVVQRDPRKTKEALDAYAHAIASFEKAGGKTGGDEKGARYAYALARFRQADQDYERFLGLAFPGGLDFDPAHPAVAARSMKRFEAWFEAKTRAGARARERYEQIIAIKDAANAIAAAARVGQIYQHFGDQLFTAEIPANLRVGPYAAEAIETYCGALTEKAEPLAAKSLDAFGACLDVSTRVGWFNEWSRLCERELGQIEPDKYPTASELRPDVDAVSTITDVERPIAQL